jgi:hypothetical protein
VALEHDAESRPNFAAPIYGALWEEIIVPADAPPLFIALANDDELAVEPSMALYGAWRAASHRIWLPERYLQETRVSSRMAAMRYAIDHHLC